MYEFGLLVFIPATVDRLCIFFFKDGLSLNLHPFAVLVL